MSNFLSDSPSEILCRPLSDPDLPDPDLSDPDFGRILFAASVGKPRRVSVGAISLVMVAGLLLSSCSRQPWVDSRREAGTLETVGESTPDRPVVCYDDAVTPLRDIQTMANAVCAKSGRSARYLGSTHWQCRILTPDRAYFVCQ